MKKKQDNKLIIFGIIIIIVLAVISFAIKEPKRELNYDEMTEEEVRIAVNESIKLMEEKDLSALGERDRMEYYFSKFIKAIQNKKYDDAYKMLYEEFRNNYFPTLSSFEEYAKTKFPRSFAVEHINIERNGDIYVMWVKITNLLGSKDSGQEMNFIIQENDLNDFVLSFSVN